MIKGLMHQEGTTMSGISSPILYLIWRKLLQIRNEIIFKLFYSLRIESKTSMSILKFSQLGTYYIILLFLR